MATFRCFAIALLAFSGGLAQQTARADCLSRPGEDRPASCGAEKHILAFADDDHRGRNRDRRHAHESHGQEALFGRRHHEKRDYGWWRRERARRQAAIDAYIAANRDAFDHFRTAPLAIKQDPQDFVGMPMIVFRLLPEIFPDIWGPPKDKMAVVGLGPDPFDPESVMPLGTGFALSNGFQFEPTGTQVQVNYATFTCMGCHSGGVVDAKGRLRRLIGSAGRFGNYFGKVNATVNDPRFQPLVFKLALDEKPLGWVYGFDPAYLDQEKLERELFDLPGGAAYFLNEVKFASNQGAKRTAETLGVATYAVPHAALAAGMPGSLDVFSLGGAQVCDPSTCDPTAPDVLPPAPGPADLPAVWQQADRPRFQWDDSVSNILYREILASLSVSGGNAAAVNQENAEISANFTENLPSAPYPFDIDRRAAERGAAIYQQACASCHAPGNNLLMSPHDTGTSPNRSLTITPYIQDQLRIQARNACTIPACFESDGSDVPDEEILQATGAYASLPLAGVWATAPYLHNGSVPTLYHLLTGERPDHFYRGNYTYDQRLVGFTWDRVTNPSGLALLYDTSRNGYSNAGHTGPAFTGGIDFQAEPDKLWDLLEYLKTL